MEALLFILPLIMAALPSFTKIKSEHKDIWRSLTITQISQAASVVKQNDLIVLEQLSKQPICG